MSFGVPILLIYCNIKLGGGTWFISARWNIPEFSEIFPAIELVSIVYLRYCDRSGGSYVNKIVSYLIWQQFLKNIWGTYNMLKCCDAWIMRFHKLRRMGGSSKPYSLQHTIKILKYATIKAQCSCFMILFLFCWSKINFILKIVNFNFQVRPNWFGVLNWYSVNYAI